jgi:hydrogenase/urease accessory protein HupE
MRQLTHQLRQGWSLLLALIITLCWPALVLAHVQQGQAQGFMTGLSHPISGLDLTTCWL